MKKIINKSFNLVYSCFRIAIEKTDIFVLLILIISAISLSSLLLLS